MNRYLCYIISGIFSFQLMSFINVNAEPPIFSPSAKVAGFRGMTGAQTKTQPAGKTDNDLACSVPTGPTAVYAEKARKTFFVYLGHSDASASGKPSILISYFDHESGMVARPVVVAEEKGITPPVLALDDAGFIWIVSASAGEQAGSIYKSGAGFAIDRFERVADNASTHPHAWYADGIGGILLDTIASTKKLTVSQSSDGVLWGEPKELAAIAAGNEHITGMHKNKIGIAFNVFTDDAAGAGTNIYYMETSDGGKTWTTAAKEKLELPLNEIENKAMVFDYAAAKRFVFLKDINFDARGFPTVLVLTSRGIRVGPESAPYLWSTARWTGRDWEISGLIQSDHHCDSGALAIEDKNMWRLFATTDPSAEPWAPGGEVSMWTTDDFGRAWQRGSVTSKSPSRYHNIHRPINAQPACYVFWNDDDASGSHLYFANRDGQAFILPSEMSEDLVQPEPFGQGPAIATAPASAPEN